MSQVNYNNKTYDVTGWENIEDKEGNVYGQRLIIDGFDETDTSEPDAFMQAWRNEEFEVEGDINPTGSAVNVAFDGKKILALKDLLTYTPILTFFP